MVINYSMITFQKKFYFRIVKTTVNYQFTTPCAIFSIGLKISIKKENLSILVNICLWLLIIQ